MGTQSLDVSKLTLRSVTISDINLIVDYWYNESNIHESRKTYLNMDAFPSRKEFYNRYLNAIKDGKKLMTLIAEYEEKAIGSMQSPTLISLQQIFMPIFGKTTF